MINCNDIYFISTTFFVLFVTIYRSAAPSQIGLSLIKAPVQVKRKKKDDSDDSSDDNQENSKGKLNATVAISDSARATAVAWAKHAENCKRSKSAAHDNYDASKFVSQYRKPLGNMCPNRSALTSGSTSTPTSSAAGSSHVCLLFLLGSLQ